MIPKTVQQLIELNSQEGAVYNETIVLSLINTNYVSVIDQGTSNPAIRQSLVDFFLRKQRQGSVNELFEKTYPRAEFFPEGGEPYSVERKVDILIGREKLFTPPFLNKQLFYLSEKDYYFNLAEGIFINLADDYRLDKNAFVDRDFYATFFLYRFRLREAHQLDSFLIVNWYVHFLRDASDFKRFLKREIQPKLESHLNLVVEEFIHRFLIEGKSTKSKSQEIVKDIPLEQFFSEKYEGKANAELFRSEVIDKILMDKKLVTYPKRVLSQVVNWLIEQRIWRQDLEWKTVAYALKKELRFPILNHQKFQPSKRIPLSPKLLLSLKSIQWKEQKKSV